jgi:hypothetical protein
VIHLHAQLRHQRRFYVADDLLRRPRCFSKHVDLLDLAARTCDHARRNNLAQLANDGFNVAHPVVPFHRH